MSRKYLILLLFLLTSCSTYFTYSRSRASVAADTFITLDQSYSFYVREVYVTDSNSDRIMKTNFSSQFQSARKLIEIEYLLISGNAKNVLYFATIPDKWQRYYSTHFLGD